MLLNVNAASLNGDMWDWMFSQGKQSHCSLDTTRNLKNADITPSSCIMTFSQEMIYTRLREPEAKHILIFMLGLNKHVPLHLK